MVNKHKAGVPTHSDVSQNCSAAPPSHAAGTRRRSLFSPWCLRPSERKGIVGESATWDEPVDVMDGYLSLTQRDFRRTTTIRPCCACEQSFHSSTGTDPARTPLTSTRRRRRSPPAVVPVGRVITIWEREDRRTLRMPPGGA